MRIALTGATGFVGQHVMRHLRVLGWEVSALVRDPARLESSDGLTVVAGELSNKDALAGLCARADAVLHVAGAISSINAEGFDTVNRAGTVNVLAAAQQAGVRRFVHVSSLAAREPGLSPYAKSKAAGERVIQDAGDGISTLILRPAAIYGEGDMATLPLLKALMSRVALLPGRRDNRFSLVHVDDFAAICAAALVSDKTGMVEIGGEALTWDDVVLTTQSQQGRPSKLILLPKPVAMAVGWGGEMSSRFTGKPAMINRAKMREIYHADWTVSGDGWPGVELRSLADGLAATILWYQDKGLIYRRNRKTK